MHFILRVGKLIFTKSPEADALVEINPVAPREGAGRYFTDENLFTRCMEAVIYKNWLLACSASQLRRPGDYLTLDVVNQDTVITCTRAEEIKAFYNACQHPRHKLNEGSGNRKLLVRLYHACS